MEAQANDSTRELPSATALHLWGAFVNIGWGSAGGGDLQPRGL